LKLSVVFDPCLRIYLSALDPGKQGLKPIIRHACSIQRALSALDPGKQGLKHVIVSIGKAIDSFQRLIQENKD